MDDCVYIIALTDKVQIWVENIITNYHNWESVYVDESGKFLGTPGGEVGACGICGRNEEARRFVLKKLNSADIDILIKHFVG